MSGLSAVIIVTDERIMGREDGWDGLKMQPTTTFRVFLWLVPLRHGPTCALNGIISGNSNVPQPYRCATPTHNTWHNFDSDTVAQQSTISYRTVPPPSVEREPKRTRTSLLNHPRRPRPSNLTRVKQFRPPTLASDRHTSGERVSVNAFPRPFYLRHIQ